MMKPGIAGTILTLVLALGTAVDMHAAGDNPEPDLAPLESDSRSSAAPAAIVNGEPITVGQADSTVANVLQGRPVNASSLAQLQAEILAQLIDRALIMQMLTKSGKIAPATTITQAMEQVKKQAADQKVDFAKMLAERKLTEDQLREQLAWQISWGKYVQERLDDAALRVYFQAHKRDYDGTEVRVSHILLRPDGAGSIAETEQLKKMVAKLREQIESGKMKFEDAALRYSAGPSRRKQGDLGFIPRQGLMLESFAAAAFKLEENQLSEPVTTPYGVHLIKVTDTKPGRKTWLEVKDQLKGPATQELFEKVAAAQRQKANIEFSDKYPHFEQGTKQLVGAANDK